MGGAPHLVEEALGAGEDSADLLLHLERGVLVLLEQLGEQGAALEQLLGGSVQVGAELGEGGDLACGGRTRVGLQLRQGLSVGVAAAGRDSRYWARSSFMEPETCFMALIWAAVPTRLTLRPTLMAGRMPW